MAGCQKKALTHHSWQQLQLTQHSSAYVRNPSLRAVEPAAQGWPSKAGPRDVIITSARLPGSIVICCVCFISSHLYQMSLSTFE